MSLISLNCPACSASLQVPDQLDVAHCMYCGSQILVEKLRDNDSRELIQRLLDLSGLALKVRNFEEALQYSNRILEMNSANIDAWLNKALATVGPSIRAPNAFAQGIEYVNRAELIAPVHNRIRDVRNYIMRLQADYCAYVARTVLETMPLLDSTNGDICLKISMQEMLEATELFPDDMNYLILLAEIASSFPTMNWGAWDGRVVSKLNKYHLAQDKLHAVEKLPQLRTELENAQNALATLRSRGSIFTRNQIRVADEKVKWLQLETARLEALVAK